MVQVNKEKYPLVHTLPSRSKGVYGVFPIKGKDKNVCQYVGESLDLYRRCYKDHQKPSQFLLAKLVLGIDGFNYYEGVKYKNKFSSYWDYQDKAIEVRQKYEFRLLDSDTSKEYDYIRNFNPVYNIKK